MFDGDTYNRERDYDRLNKQQKEIFDIVIDGEWRTLSELEYLTDYRHPPQSISARLRDFRKKKFGGFLVERKYIINGIHSYRVLK